jgi:hypothetical protein
VTTGVIAENKSLGELQLQFPFFYVIGFRVIVQTKDFSIVLGVGLFVQ